MKINVTLYRNCHKVMACIIAISFLFSNIAYANPDLTTLSAQSRLQPINGRELLFTHSALQELFLGSGALLEGLSLEEH